MLLWSDFNSHTNDVVILVQMLLKFQINLCVAVQDVNKVHNGVGYLL